MKIQKIESEDKNSLQLLDHSFDVPDYDQNNIGIYNNTFNSNKLNFEDDKDDIEYQEVLSPMFTQGYESFKKEFGFYNFTEEDRENLLLVSNPLNIINDVKDQISRQSPKRRKSTLNDILNMSINKLRKRRSSLK